jgi:hypothetical protein
VEHPFRSLSTFLAVGVVVVAIVGYVVGVRGNGSGHKRPAPASTQQLRPAFAASVLLESPSGWLTTPATRTIPALPMEHAVLFAPRGDASQAGLLTGQLGGGEPSPLPAAFVERLRDLPRTEVVNLSQGEAYRYSHVSLPGFERLLTIYVIPRSGGGPTALACYATARYAHEIRTCEQIVSTMRPVGQSSTEVLAPDPEYARRVSATVAALDRERDTVRRAVRDGATGPKIARLATRLSQSFARAAVAIGALEPSLAAGQAQAELSRAMQRARDAYKALAAAAGSGETAAYESASVQAAAAEASIGSALKGYSLLGYVHG